MHIYRNHHVGLIWTHYLPTQVPSLFFAPFHAASSIFQDVSPATVVEFVVQRGLQCDPCESCASFSEAPAAVEVMRPIVLRPVV